MTDISTLRPTERAQTLAVAERIAAAIDAAGGWLRFDRYMELALFEPGLGYYSAGAAKFGAAGDFTTAPELSDVLVDGLAAVFAPALARMQSPTLLELGAGSGRLARRIIARLEACGVQLDRYLILEPSADLRERQRLALAKSACPVSWLDALPESPIEAVVFGNEVADVLPVVPFVKTADSALPLGVVVDGKGFAWAKGEPDPAVSRGVAAIERRVGREFEAGFRSEFCPALPAWVTALAESITAGGLMLIDYGLPSQAYYHEDKDGGTLICHYRHRAHADPFLLPGLQDITAWVDFSVVAESAAAAGLTLSGFTTQGQFLAEMLTAGRIDVPADVEGQSALKTLLLPGEMGERFKMIWLTRDLPFAEMLPGRDFRGWL